MRSKKVVANLTPKILFWRYASAGLITLSMITLVGLEIEPLGWILLTASFLLLRFIDYEFQRYFILVIASTAVLGLAPIGTSTGLPFAFYMGLGLFGAVAIPYLVTKYLYKSDTIRFPSLKEKGWSKKRFGYLLLTAFIAWLIFPILLRSDSIYLNWDLQPGFWYLFEAYMGLNAVGIWDELFFIITLFAIFLRFFPFVAANIFQAVFFTSFLYAVGFESWSFIVIFFFALLQGYIYSKTKSLLFILAIHLTIDLVLHLALVHLHYPNLFPYFIT